MHDLAGRFLREQMKLSTPLAKLPSISAVVNAFKKLNADWDSRFYHFWLDLQATLLENVWPTLDSPPPTKEGIIWAAAQKAAGNNITSKRTLDETPDQTHTKKAKSGSKSGRKKGSKGWTQSETDSLLDLVKDFLPNRSYGRR